MENKVGIQLCRSFYAATFRERFAQFTMSTTFNSINCLLLSVFFFGRCCVLCYLSRFCFSGVSFLFNFCFWPFCLTDCIFSNVSFLLFHSIPVRFSCLQISCPFVFLLYILYFNNGALGCLSSLCHVQFSFKS